jgi:hypothetical protein
MRRYIIDDTGKILTTLQGDSNMVELNTAPDAVFIDTNDIVNISDYYDFDQHRFISIGEALAPHCIFDYEIKQWIDPRSLDDIKAQKWSEIKAMRNQLEFGGFEFGGGIYDSNQVSQGRIMGAAGAGMDQTWTLADNTTVNLTASQLQQLYAALQAHIASVHERGRIARQLIFDAETKEQVEAVQL